MGIQRKPRENLRSFWLMFVKLHNRLTLSNAAFRTTVLRIRSLTALKLTITNRPLVLTAPDARAIKQTSIDLEKASLRLLQSFGATDNVLFETDEAEVESVARAENADEKFRAGIRTNHDRQSGDTSRNRPGPY